MPTEAEWEWLSRKANKKKARKFSWGDNFIIPDNYLNIADESAQSKQRNFVKDYDDGYENLAEIGSFNKEKSGLYDLSGNLSEWVHDIIQLLSNKIEKDPLGKKRIKSCNQRCKLEFWYINKIRPSYRENGIKEMRQLVLE